MNRLRRLWCAIIGHRPTCEAQYIYNNNVTTRCRRCGCTTSWIGGRWVRL